MKCHEYDPAVPEMLFETVANERLYTLTIDYQLDNKILN